MFTRAAPWREMREAVLFLLYSHPWRSQEVGWHLKQG